LGDKKTGSFKTNFKVEAPSAHEIISFVEGFQKNVEGD
jgi:hypothetical protein